MKKRSCPYFLIAALLSAVLFPGGAMAQQEDAAGNKEFEILKNLEIFSSAYKNIELVYVDEANPGEMIKSALDAMLRTLDPYTVYIPEADIEDFRIMTEGEYGGIGSTIHYRDGWVYISEPYEGFPADLAGLKPGDKILAINGESTQGKNAADVSAMLKGQAGTSLLLTISRQGKAKPFEVELTRREIKIRNVTYSGMLRDSVGYIRQDGFTQGAAQEVKDAFLALKAQGMKYLVYDLRYNGGGLLNEAVDIVNLFCQKGLPVVSTKGKTPSRNHTYYTTKDPLDTRMPIVFLTSRGTASASEILTGAMQDYDRAVLAGERTFGKGLVQNILPLPYNAQLKVTVAKYYIPSGRCVQALDYSHKDSDGLARRIPDSLRTAFKTMGGRIVYDGDGIEPDVEIQPPVISNVSVSLITKFLLFDYANRYASRHEKLPPVQDFQITDAIYEDFMAFMAGKDYAYELPSQQALEDFKAVAESDSCFPAVESRYKDLAGCLEETKRGDLLEYKDEISALLREEIVSRYYYQKGRAEAELQGDPTVNEAVSILLDKARYQSFLTAGKKDDSTGLQGDAPSGGRSAGKKGMIGNEPGDRAAQGRKSSANEQAHVRNPKPEDMQEKQKEWMREAIALAEENVSKGGGPFGALIVKDGEVIARTGNTVTLSNDPTAHAEVNAIREACRRLDTFDLSGCEIYSSCEPCPMCLSALYWARVEKIYFAGSRHDAADAGFDDQFLYDEIGKPLSQRKIPVTVLMPEEGKEPFAAWKRFEGKITY